MDPDLDKAWVDGVRSSLIGWFRESARPLPWRRDRDPYRVLVSESMLVQTTVKAVVPHFERFTARFPDFESLAAADVEDVVKAWEGLGYYRRARQLHAAASRIARDFGGLMPDDPGVVRDLPGVGRYMAGAILSFAFDRPQPIVEANSERVIARLLALRGDTRTGAVRERIWQAAQRMVPPREAGRFNQALIELGALVCSPRRPACLVCPLTSYCRARGAGLEQAIPEPRVKAPPLAVVEACAIVSQGGLVLVVQRGSGGLWERFWEFPTVHVEGADPGGRSSIGPVDLSSGLPLLTGVQARIGSSVRTIRYSVTKHRVELRAHEGEAVSGELRPGPGLIDARWVDPRSLASLTMSSASRRLATWVAKEALDREGEAPGRASQ